jgi:hypothetical protein
VADQTHSLTRFLSSFLLASHNLHVLIIVVHRCYGRWCHFCARSLCMVVVCVIDFFPLYRAFACSSCLLSGSSNVVLYLMWTSLSCLSFADLVHRPCLHFLSIFSLMCYCLHFSRYLFTNVLYLHLLRVILGIIEIAYNNNNKVFNLK